VDVKQLIKSATSGSNTAIYTSAAVLVAGLVFVLTVVLFPGTGPDLPDNSITSSQADPQSTDSNEFPSASLSMDESLESLFDSTASSASGSSSFSTPGSSQSTPGSSSVSTPPSSSQDPSPTGSTPVPIPTASPAELQKITQRDLLFANPPAAYRVTELIAGGTRFNIADMENKKLGGAYTSVSWGKTDYLSNELAWIALNQDLSRAQDAGFVSWIWDEKGYPSGAAGGLTVEGHPEYEARGVYKVVLPGEGTGQKEVLLPTGSEKILSAVLYPVSGSIVQWNQGTSVTFTDAKATTSGRAGKWELWVVVEKILDEDSHAMLMKDQFNATGKYPNLMDRAAVRRFIDITHEKYKEKVPDFSSKIYGFMAPEPSLMTHFSNSGQRAGGIAYFPWERTIPARFQQKFGYDLIPVLPYLLGGDSETNKRVRYHYYTIVGDLMTENFTGQITEWAENNGVKASGYFFCEENVSQHVALFGNFIQAMGEYSVQAADARLMPHNNFNPQLHGLKYASSAARLNGKYKVIAFMDPLLGGYVPNSNFTIQSDVLIRNINILTHYGANAFGTYGHISTSDAANYAQYNLYAGRVGVLLQDAVDKAETALYYPIETFQGRYIPTPLNVHSEPSTFSDIEGPQRELSQALANQSIDFNHIDAQAVLGASIEGNILVIGNNKYKVVIMPAVELIEYSVIRKLNQFEDAGGKVIYYKTRPSIAGKANETNTLKSAVSDKMLMNEMLQVIYATRQVIGSKVDIETTLPVLYSRHSKNTRELIFLINTSASNGSVTLAFEGAKTGRLHNPENGHITEITFPHTFNIGGYLGMFIEITG
jgi:hypothetical protein